MASRSRAAGAASAGRKVTLTLPWLAEGSNAYAFVAKQNGYWADAGLDVQISPGYGSVAAAQAVAASQFDFALAAAPSAIAQFAKGLGVVAICNCGYDATMGVAVLDDSPVRVPKDLVGRQMGATVTSGEYPFLPAFAKNAGFDLSTVNIVPSDANERNRLLIERKVEALSGFAASIAPSLVANKLKARFMLFSGFGLKFYNNALLTRPQMIQQAPQLCAAMADGIAQAIKFCLLQPDQALNAFLKQVPEVGQTAGGPLQVRTGMGIFATTMFAAPARQHGIGVSDAGDYGAMAELVTRHLGAPGDSSLKAETLFTNEFVGKVAMNEAEWSQADDKLKEFRYFFG